jgi:hypothetical protein
LLPCSYPLQNEDLLTLFPRMENRGMCPWIYLSHLNFFCDASLSITEIPDSHFLYPFPSLYLDHNCPSSDSIQLLLRLLQESANFPPSLFVLFCRLSGLCGRIIYTHLTLNPSFSCLYPEEAIFYSPK